ncbi:MAG: sulfite exporter TauE/SafE family protein [Bdellovibrionales bacterium]|nr:sulfite exporter TauE/SafE family protein [Bdellovibrionales bacterium]
MEMLGYFAALVMGAVLGLIGGGGSILTVPILVYLLKVDALSATGYSLFIVGLSACFGAYSYWKKGMVDFKTGAIFSVPAFLGVYLVRKFGVPMLPDVIVEINNWQMTKSFLILIVFALMMILASISMIRGRKNAEGEKNKKFNYPLIALEGVVVGAFTGFVGAGGGFLIIPALVVLAGLEMKVAVGTSLMIIAIKSLFGFIGDIQNNSALDWQLLGLFTAIAVVGIFLGTLLSNKIPGDKLKPAFGWFVLIMGSFMILKETLLA